MFEVLLAALFYALASFLITLTNKVVLTSYKCVQCGFNDSFWANFHYNYFSFPSFQALAFGQTLVTLCSLYIAKKLKLFDFPNFSLASLKKVTQ
jgi:hypothetical protein